MKRAATKMAIADFGGSVLGRKIILLSADHQNKADIGSSKAREWTDQRGLNMLLAGVPLAQIPNVFRLAGGARQRAARHDSDIG
jgi:hypothetical protein